MRGERLGSSIVEQHYRAIGIMSPTTNGQILHAVAIKVAHRHNVWETAARRRCAERRKSAAAIAAQDGNPVVLSVGDDQIDVAVTIQIRSGNRSRPVAGGERAAWRRSEAAESIPQQHRYCVVANVGNGKV